MNTRTRILVVAWIIGLMSLAAVSNWNWSARADDTDTQKVQAATAPAAPAAPKAPEQDENHTVKAVIDLSDDEQMPKEVLDKLTPEQLYELMKLRAIKEPDVPGQVPVIVALVFGCPVAIVAVVLFYRYRKNQQLHRTMALMIEKGTPIPPDLLAPQSVKTKASDLRRGIVLIAVGLGLIGFFLAQKEDAWGLGLIPLLVGLGYLVVWKLEQNKQVG